MGDPIEHTTELLNRFSGGDASVSDELLERIHSELKKLAAVHMARERPDHSLQPTALVNEAWISLVNLEGASWESRRHFYAMASKMMRTLLVGHARERKAQKRGGDRLRIPLDEQGTTARGAPFDVLEMNDALEELTRIDEELGRIAELRFFGGLSVQETADTLEMPLRTVERRLRSASAWLRDRLGE